MSSRKASRPDLAIADVRPTWTPRVGDRVRLVTQTRLAQVTHGTATIIDLPRDSHDRTMGVSADLNSNAYPRDHRWLHWPIAQVRPATIQPPREEAAADVEADGQADGQADVEVGAERAAAAS